MSYVFHKIAFKKLTPGRVVRTLNGKSFVKLDIEKLVTPTHSHKYGSTWMSDAHTHWHECSCTDRTDIGVHVDRDGDGKCDICRHTLPVTPPDHTHEYNSNWSHDAYTHWQECSCGKRSNISAHADNNKDGKCDTCGYSMPIPPEPEIPPILVDKDRIDLRIFGFEPGKTYILRATAEAMSLQLRESDMSDHIEYKAK